MCLVRKIYSILKELKFKAKGSGAQALNVSLEKNRRSKSRNHWTIL
jgi:hypothetical protein